PLVVLFRLGRSQHLERSDLEPQDYRARQRRGRGWSRQHGLGGGGQARLSRRCKTQLSSSSRCLEPPERPIRRRAIKRPVEFSIHAGRNARSSRLRTQVGRRRHAPGRNRKLGQRPDRRRGLNLGPNREPPGLPCRPVQEEEKKPLASLGQGAKPNSASEKQL